MPKAKTPAAPAIDPPVQVQIRLPLSVRERLREWAYKHRRSLAADMRLAVEAGMAQWEMSDRMERAAKRKPALTAKPRRAAPAKAKPRRAVKAKLDVHGAVS